MATPTLHADTQVGSNRQTTSGWRHWPQQAWWPWLTRGVAIAFFAVVAALIGAGGFGALVFQGLLSSALDLVLLGVVPTIALAVVVDALFALWGAWLKGEAND